MFNKLHKVAVSVATSGALVLALGSVLSPTTAFAKDPRPPHVTTSTTQVDPNKPGVIHVVKYDDGEGAKPANGAKDQGMPGKGHPIEGIEFTLTPVKVVADDSNRYEVNTILASHDAEGLKKLASLTPEEVADACDNETPSWGCNLSSGVKKKTDAHGQIDFTEDTLHNPLKADLYLLRETNSVAADGKTYKKAPASLIFLPMTNPSGDGWLTSDDGSKYEVWVYPKNSLEDNIKAVDDANKQVGDDITYTISASVPAVHALTPEQKETATNAGITSRTYDLNNFGFWDNLDQHLQLIDASSVKVKYTQADGTLGDLTAKDFVAKVYAGSATDKDMPGTPVATGATDGGQKLVVALTSDGLQKVAVAKAKYAGTNVYLSFTPKVIKSGIVANKAQLYKTYGQNPGLAEVANPELPFNAPTGMDTFTTNTVVSAWGKLAITKTDEKDHPLGHAKFKVYGKKKNEAAFNYAAGQELTVNGVSEFESDAQGHVTIDGLHATNLENTGADVNGYEKYALVEVKAPDGYELDRGPREFTIDVATSMDKVIADDSWQIDDDGVVTASDLVVAAEVTGFADDTQTADIADAGAWLNRKVTVVNIPVKPRLPLTGGAGIAIFGLLGGGLLLGGLYAAKRNSRQAK